MLDFSTKGSDLLKAPEEEAPQHKKCFKITRDISILEQVRMERVQADLQERKKDELKSLKSERKVPRACERLRPRSTQIIIDPKSRYTSSRKDIAQKSSIRFIRRYYKNIFKYQNLEVVRRRYVNCSANHLYPRMKMILTGMFSEGRVTDELIYFTMAVTGLKRESEIPCSASIKREIREVNS